LEETPAEKVDLKASRKRLLQIVSFLSLLFSALFFPIVLLFAQFFKMMSSIN